MYVCVYEQFPDVPFSTSSDQTGLVPGLVCSRLEKPLPGGTTSEWFSFNKILRLIEAGFI